MTCPKRLLKQTNKLTSYFRSFVLMVPVHDLGLPVMTGDDLHHHPPLSKVSRSIHPTNMTSFPRTTSIRTTSRTIHNPRSTSTVTCIILHPAFEPRLRTVKLNNMSCHYHNLYGNTQAIYPCLNPSLRKIVISCNQPGRPRVSSRRSGSLAQTRQPTARRITQLILPPLQPAL